MTKTYRTAKGGDHLKTTRLDGKSHTRLAYCKRAITEHLAVPCSDNAVIRRALTLLEQHLQSLVAEELGDTPEEKEWHLWAEKGLIRLANEGQASKITAQDVTNSPTLKTIKELEKEWEEANPPKPLLLQTINYKYRPRRRR